MKRLSIICSQLGTSSANSVTSGYSLFKSADTAHYSNRSSRGSPDDVIICCAVRTALTKGSRGGFKDIYPEDLLMALFKGLLSRVNIDPQLIQDICIGNVLQPGSGAVTSRMAELMAGYKESTPIFTVNRQCSSGLQAVANIAGAIKAGYIDIGIGGGVESMTHYDMMSTLQPEKLSEDVFEHESARNCLMSMGITSENVAEKYGIKRISQDLLAVESHAKAAKAQKMGNFKDEIIPIKAKVKGADGKVEYKIIDRDDGIRENTTLETLAKLKPAFQEGGSTTAGNSSQVSDGAALVLLARRSAAEKYNLPILARFVTFVAVGVPPEIMGIGPAIAIPAVLSKAGLTMDDIDIFEINEAFGSQACYCVSKLGIPNEKLNPNGGAIALGHPLGCTGARQIATLLPELKRRQCKYGIVSMCIGTGMGAAAVIENLQF